MALQIVLTDDKLKYSFPEGYVKVSALTKNFDNSIVTVHLQTFADAGARAQNAQLGVVRMEMEQPATDESGDQRPDIYERLRASPAFADAIDV